MHGVQAIGNFVQYLSLLKKLGWLIALSVLKRSFLHVQKHLAVVAMRSRIPVTGSKLDLNELNFFVYQPRIRQGNLQDILKGWKGAGFAIRRATFFVSGIFPVVCIVVLGIGNWGADQQNAVHAYGHYQSF